MGRHNDAPKQAGPGSLAKLPRNVAAGWIHSIFRTAGQSTPRVAGVGASKMSGFKKGARREVITTTAEDWQNLPDEPDVPKDKATMDAINAAVKNNYVFASLPDEDVETVVRKMQKETVRAGRAVHGACAHARPIHACARRVRAVVLAVSIRPRRTRDDPGGARFRSRAPPSNPPANPPVPPPPVLPRAPSSRVSAETISTSRPWSPRMSTRAHVRVRPAPSANGCAENACGHETAPSRPGHGQYARARSSCETSRERVRAHRAPRAARRGEMIQRGASGYRALGVRFRGG